jgi:hypothetical protein
MSMARKRISRSPATSLQEVLFLMDHKGNRERDEGAARRRRAFAGPRRAQSPDDHGA